MKKLFVSLPMKGRTKEEIISNIEKMKKAAELLEGEELELIDSHIEVNPSKDSKESIFFLGESIKKMAQSDVFIGLYDTDYYTDCTIEKMVAQSYDIKYYLLPQKYVIEKE